MASQIISRYKEAPDAEKQSVLVEQLSRPDVDDAVRTRVQRKLEDEAKGITSIDRQVKNLTVAKRAQYYSEKIKDLTPLQAPLYIQDQIEKGVMSKRVIDVIQDKESFKQFFGE